VSARPGPAVAVLGMSAAIWFLRIGGVFGESSDPLWTYAIVGVDLVVGTMLLLNVGPAKQLAQLAALLHMALAALLTWGDVSVLSVAYFAHGAVLLAMLVREPSGLRMRAGLVAGGALALLCTLLLVFGAKSAG
jgi:hypothetical protein